MAKDRCCSNNSKVHVVTIAVNGHYVNDGTPVWFPFVDDWQHQIELSFRICQQDSPTHVTIARKLTTNIHMLHRGYSCLREMTIYINFHLCLIWWTIIWSPYRSRLFSTQGEILSALYRVSIYLYFPNIYHRTVLLFWERIVDTALCQTFIIAVVRHIVAVFPLVCYIGVWVTLHQSPYPHTRGIDVPWLFKWNSLEGRMSIPYQPFQLHSDRKEGRKDV